MIHKKHIILLVALFAVVIPGSSQVVQAKSAKKNIRIAMLAPRGTSVVRAFKKIDKNIEKATNGEWGIKVYASGVAGDEKDILRKMRVGQMDATVVTTTGLSQIVPQIAILDVPGVIESYPELEAVQKSLNKEWEEMFLKAGFKLLSWGETGQYRFFSKIPLYNAADFRKTRPWLWPESHVMKELWKIMGANFVPLQVPEVYGALQTGMVDMVINTALAFVSLRWHSNLKYVSEKCTGVLIMAMIMNDDKWEGLPEVVKKEMLKTIEDNADTDAKEVRKADKKAYKMLLKRGYTSYKNDEKEWKGIEAKVVKRVTGRIFPAELLKRVRAITGPIRAKQGK